MNWKMNKAKKVLSTILALTFVLLFSSMPALAEEAAAPENGNTEAVSTESDNNYILSVIVPTTVSISLDPLELDGMGPIYSSYYTIANCGDTDVLLTFNSIQVIFSNGSDLVALAQPFDEESKSDMRAIYLVMNFGPSGIPPLVLTDTQRREPVPILLSSPQSDSANDSQLSVSFSGNLNPYPAVAWSDGDVKINITYTLETIPPPKVEVSPSPEPSPETSSAIDTTSPETSTAVEATSPEPSIAVDAAAPEPSAAVVAATPEPSAPADVTTPEPSSTVETAAPEPSAAVEATAPEPSAASEVTAPEQPAENGSP